MQQHGSKYFDVRSPYPPQALEMGSIGQNSTFVEHGHVHITKCSNIVANVLSADTPPPRP